MNLGYVIIYVPNVAATVLFYERAFGLQRRFIHEGGDYAEMETGTTALAFAAEPLIAAIVPHVHRNRAENAPAAVEVSLVTADVAQSFRNAVSAGASPILAPTAKPWGQTVSYVRDNNGVLVEICSAVAQQSKPQTA